MDKLKVIPDGDRQRYVSVQVHHHIKELDVHNSVTETDKLTELYNVTNKKVANVGLKFESIKSQRVHTSFLERIASECRQSNAARA